jgi:hypothetical protein
MCRVTYRKSHMAVCEYAWTAPDLVGSSYLDDLAAELQPPHGSEDERRGGHVDVQEREIVKDGGVRVTGW